MMKGNSLEQDLRLLINNPKYSDIEILCNDGEKFYCSRAILAARSDVFNGLLYNGMKESYENQISFPIIDSSVMEIILEYVYTGSIREESLTKDNTIEVFYAADFFQLLNLQDFVLKTIKNNSKNEVSENYSPEWLSKVVEIVPLTDDNTFLSLLVELVASIPLNHIEFGRLSIAGFKYLLSYTREKEKFFITSEYEVLRYSIILAAKQISGNTSKSLIKRLPTLHFLKQCNYAFRLESKFNSIHRQKLIKELEPLTKLIDFRRIKGQILVDIIEPLEIVPNEIILNAYRYNTKSNNLMSNTRGMPYLWDESACGSKLVIKDDERVVSASYELSQTVRAKMKFENGGIFEWDIIIEKMCTYAYVGVCAPEYFKYEKFDDRKIKDNIWVLSSNGNCYSSEIVQSYCPSFKDDDTKITVHLNMNQRTCSFTINGTKYPEVSNWRNLPSKLYPVVGLEHPGQFRIQPANKIIA